MAAATFIWPISNTNLHKKKKKKREEEEKTREEKKVTSPLTFVCIQLGAELWNDEFGSIKFNGMKIVTSMLTGGWVRWVGCISDLSKSNASIYRRSWKWKLWFSRVYAYTYADPETYPSSHYKAHPGADPQTYHQAHSCPYYPSRISRRYNIGSGE